MIGRAKEFVARETGAMFVVFGLAVMGLIAVLVVIALVLVVGRS